MPEATHLYAIAIGSNRMHGRHGRPPQVVQAAIERLELDFNLFDASPILINPAHGLSGREFANAVVLVESDLTPPALLARLKVLEQAFGRRRGKRWGSRVLDLDILIWSGGNWRSRGLTIPHRHLPSRGFVLQPLVTIAPDMKVDGAIAIRHLAHRLARSRPAADSSHKSRPSP